MSQQPIFDVLRPRFWLSTKGISPWEFSHQRVLFGGRSHSIHFLDVWQNPSPIEERFFGRIETEVGKPRLAGNARNPVLGFVARWLAWSHVDGDRAIVVFHQVHPRGTVRNFLLVLNQASRVDIIDRDGPKRFGGGVGGNVQNVVLSTVKPIAVTVLIRTKIHLSFAGFLSVHYDVVRHRFIEPGGSPIERIVILTTLVGRCDGGELPMRSVDAMGILHALCKVVRFGHRFTDQYGLLKNLLLASTGLEWLALEDSQRREHRQKKAITLEYQLTIDHVGESNPIVHSARLGGQPLLAVWSDIATGFWIVALRPRINRNVLEQFHSLVAIGVTDRVKMRIGSLPWEPRVAILFLSHLSN